MSSATAMYLGLDRQAEVGRKEALIPPRPHRRKTVSFSRRKMDEIQMDAHTPSQEEMILCAELLGGLLSIERRIVILYFGGSPVSEISDMLGLDDLETRRYVISAVNKMRHIGRS